MSNNKINISKYTEDAYLTYSMKVITDRALPNVKDGQKPVNRRILYSMKELNMLTEKNFKKSARIVGDIIGKYHPHGDQSVYKTLVAMSQDFTLRYPLIDGQGNFGSLDGDNAAAMRYTEARLTPIAETLLSELNMDAVDFVGNFDNTMKEPEMLPSRLNFLLMNGSFGIAVGMATNIPSHNIRNVSDATIHCIKNPSAEIEDIVEHLVAPDFPTGGILINSKKEIINNYKNGEGKFTVRCKWKTEDLGRGLYQLVVTELPPNVSPSKVMEKIGNIDRPKVKSGGKPTKTQIQQRQFLFKLISKVNDESNKNDGVRIVFKPRSSKDDPSVIMESLYKLLDLEINISMNLNVIGNDYHVNKKNIKNVIDEWIDFRFLTVRRRTEYSLAQISKKIHFLEAKKIVSDNIKEVVDIIQNSDDPKYDLMKRFGLTEVQAEYVLEIKLRQLAKLELEKIQNELDALYKEEAKLKELLNSKTKMKNLIIKEIESDTKKYEDKRKTEVSEAEKAVLSKDELVVDEKITALITKNGWVTYRKGHDLDLSTVKFKDEDELLKAIEGRTVNPIALVSNSGRVFNIKSNQLENGKNMIHINSLIDLKNDKIIDFLFVEDNIKYVVMNSSGYGFKTKSESLIVKNRAGKAFVTLKDTDTMFTLFEYDKEKYISCFSSDNRLLTYDIEELVELGKGKGVKLIQIPESEKLYNAWIHNSLTVELDYENGKSEELSLKENGIYAKRARRGKNIQKIVLDLKDVTEELKYDFD